MSSKASLSATNLAIHHHLNCDLYAYNVYHGSSSIAQDNAKPLSELSKAQYQRGTDWEANLFSWLDSSNLLLKVPSTPLEANSLLENIQADDRDHFFIAGLSFWPPRDTFKHLYREAGEQPVNFGLAKPDLLEVTRTPLGVKWKVIDAKASKAVKTSHHVQIYFYTVCLDLILDSPFFQPEDTVGVWLPPKDGFHTVLPSMEDIKIIDISLLAPSLDYYLYHRLPRVLTLRRNDVDWHYNPLCQGCSYETQCKTNAVAQGRLGSIPNVSIEDARTLKDLLRISRSSPHLVEGNELTDIEDLHVLLADPVKFSSLTAKSPSLVKKSRRILALPRRSRHNGLSCSSPAVEAARDNEVQVIPRRNFTCPSRENIAVFISFVLDPASPGTGIEIYCITIHSDTPLQLPPIIYGPASELVASLATIIRTIKAEIPGLRTQFYVWSLAEQSSLQAHLINAALASGDKDTDIRLCIGALAQGASLLQTTLQPMLLSGALMAFLSKGKRKKAEYEACLRRMCLSTKGTVDELRKRVEQEHRRLQTENETIRSDGDKQKEFGQLPRIVVVKKEVERLLALPIPGYWELPECLSTLLQRPAQLQCMSDEEIFSVYKKKSAMEAVKAELANRNETIYLVLQNLRSRATLANGVSLLVNEAKILSTSFMDICREATLRKLFFMQQFEVLSRLIELWQARIDGCPDAPILEYLSPVLGSKGQDHVFRLVSGTVDIPMERDHAFYDKILVRDINDGEELHQDIPVESLFNDLAVSGFVFPLNRYTKVNWDNQHSRVKTELATADIRNVTISGKNSMVTLRVWSTWQDELEEGTRYRLSPHLVDFNTTKVLSTLFEFDLQCEADQGVNKEGRQHCNTVPFLQLILDPKSFGRTDMVETYLKTENNIQRLFRDLKDLGNDSAAALVLKASQHKAAQRILSNRLSIIWGPPGTGKTYTISLSLLRLFEVQHRLGKSSQSIVFLTAMTHAAIEACRLKLLQLINCYRAIDALPTEWLNNVSIELVLNGNEHPGPSHSSSKIYVYAGTIYQLYNFSKKYSMEVNCVVVDEAGQMPLGSLALVLRSLSASGRVIIAGDSEQLAPILSAQYPQLKTRLLFGSVLDCLMHNQRPSSEDDGANALSPTPENEYEYSSQSTIVQLTENFRLNPDLGEFVSTIYSRRFKPQKVQARQLAASLRKVEDDFGKDFGVQEDVLESIQIFLISLSDVMSREPQLVLRPPRLIPEIGARTLTGIAGLSESAFAHNPISLALIRLQTWSSYSEHFGYELHVRGEAEIAAALVTSIRRCCPDDDIFVATPHRIQREAVRVALFRTKKSSLSLENALENLQIDDVAGRGQVTVDTIERLQGSEAAFVICLFSLPKSSTSDLGFLLERRRLNVAISRAKTLCILVASPEILRPSIKVLANEEIAKGYAFLKAFEERAWSYDLEVDLDKL